MLIAHALSLRRETHREKSGLLRQALRAVLLVEATLCLALFGMCLPVTRRRAIQQASRHRESWSMKPATKQALLTASRASATLEDFLLSHSRLQDLTSTSTIRSHCSSQPSQPSIARYQYRLAPVSYTNARPMHTIVDLC